MQTPYIVYVAEKDTTEKTLMVGFRTSRGLHQLARHRAIDEGISLQELIERALEEYLAAAKKKSTRRRK